MATSAALSDAVFDTQNHPSSHLYQAIVLDDHDSLCKIFASNARNSVVSYLSMKSRWARQQDSMAKSEEKLDEFLQQLSYTDSPNNTGRRFSPLSTARQQDDLSYYHVLQELSAVIGSDNASAEANASRTNTLASSLVNARISREADRLMWEASANLGDSRPPSNLCIYDRSGATVPREGQENNPPIFDGSVANATPAPLGGAAAGASGGAGTALHLACALDRPLTLAFLLIMGADGRASHTAFRRLMIHEAACNGSIKCLQLLLEMGHKFATNTGTENKDASNAVPFMPDAMELSSSSSVMHGALFPARSPPPIAMNVRYFRRGVGSFSRSNSQGNSKSDSHHDIQSKHADFLSLLRQFQNCCALVKSGEISELQAARSVLAHAPLLETTREALVRSCTFQNDTYATHSFLRPSGCADGHGNTPLHWAAFKNEKECVRLLLQYKADPNARAHPSGWTPLHDAAYSNSSECIELLVSNGAHVDARANSGATPLCFAAQEDAADAAQFLLERGADLSARCAGTQQDDATQQSLQMPSHPHSRFSGYTPLHYCAHYNAQRAARVLLAHSKARVAMETPDLSGRLPIHVAVARGSSDVLRALLHAGARVDIRPNNNGGRPPSSLPAIFGQLPEAPAARRPPLPEEPGTPNRSSSTSSSTSSSPVTSPLLRSMIPSQPINSSKPWNCLSQQAIDECKELISKAEQSWTPEHHLLFTPQDRKAIMELLRVGKRLEQNGTGIFIDLWPQVLGFCGRGWFETEDCKLAIAESGGQSEEESDGLGESDAEDSATSDDDDYLALPSFR